MTDPSAVVAAVGVYAGAFAVGALSSIVPFIIIDVFVVWIALRVGASPALVPIVALTSLGQLAGKLPMFYAARGVTSLASRRADRASDRTRAGVARMQAWVRRWNRHPHWLLAASATFGLPPFSLLATAAGALAIRVRAFCAIVLAGRTLRFAAVIAITLATRR